MDECLDPEGVYLPDVPAAHSQALRAAYSIMAADIAEGKLDLDQRIDVEDEAGNIVCAIRFRDIVTITGQVESS